MAKRRVGPTKRRLLLDRVLAWRPVVGIEDPADELFDALPEPTADRAALRPDLTIDLSLGEPGPAYNPFEEGGAEPIAYHNETNIGGLPDGRFVSWDGFSTLYVSASGDRIEGSIHPESLDDTYRFAAVTLMMASALALRLQRRFHMHLGAVRTPDDVITLVVGDSGAGKSTTTLSLVEAGSGWLCDDAAVIGRDDGAVAISGIPRPFHLTERSLEIFPALRSQAVRGRAGAGRKYDLRAWETYADRYVRCATGPYRIVLPTIDPHGNTRVEPTSAADAFGALIVCGLWAVTEGMPERDEHVELLRELASGSERRILYLGPDALEDSALVWRAIVDGAA